MILINSKKLVVLAVSLLIATVFSVFTLDFMVNNWVNYHLEAEILYIYTNLNYKSHAYVLFTSETVLFVFLLLVFGVLIHYARKQRGTLYVIILSVYLFVWLFVMLHLKTELKYVFSRCVPMVCTKPTTLQEVINAYGFTWFKKVEGFASFPSGHCLLASFCVTWATILMPRIKYFFVISYIIGFIILVAFNYHFIGDCMAGTFIGVICCISSVWIWNYNKIYLLALKKVN